MTDAPKIDTQAPERIWITSERSLWPTHRSFTASDLDHSNDDGTSDYPEYVRADLSAAREAAAAQAMREAITNSLRQAITLAEERLAGAIDEPWSTKHDKCVAGQVLYQEAIEYIELLPLPDTTALDRMIADRVQEATAELRGLLWLACQEFNAIRARSGAPLDQYGMTTVSEIWWDQLTRAIADAVGPDARKPWPSDEAKAVTAKIIARGSKEGQS